MPASSMFSLQDKVVVAIGAGGVLAGEIAKGLAEAGADVVVVDLNGEAAEARAREIERETGRRAISVQADGTVAADLKRALQRTLDEFGRVDVLLNAAGINSGTPFFEITEEEWHKILDVDLKSVFLACQIFGKAMVDAGSGSIVNISSASSGPPLSKVFTYSVAKGGVNQITQFLAREFAPHGVRVNAIKPGFFPAEQNRKLLTPERTAQIMGHTPMNRFGEANELIGAAVFLASDEAASFVTGSILTVDGGYTAMTI